MAIDDDDDDFSGWDGFGDDDDNDDYRSSDYKELPVFHKAMEIVSITRALVETIDSEKDQLEIRQQMMENAMILGAKIAGAEGGGLYSIRMDNATLIRISAKELLALTSLCKAEKLSDVRYLNILREEINKFRPLYLDWMKTFDPNDDIDDGWRLY